MNQKYKIKAFQLEDQKNWLEQLSSVGCVVIKNVISQDEVNHTKNLFWEWLEGLASGIKREDPSTWNDKNWPGSGSLGFFVAYGGCHTHASWFLRTHPRVQQPFRKIWKTNQLLTSFDTFIAWRPWWNKASKNNWDPFVERLHVDQNPKFKRGFNCIQGMLPLVKVSESGAGGLQVVPFTNNDKIQEQLCRKYRISGGDWLQLSQNDPFIGTGVLVECQAGDFILWDSRTIHGGKINDPSEDFKQKNENELSRLALTICMTPRELASQRVLQRRKWAFKEKVGLSHWPHQYQKSSFATMAENIKRENIKYEWPELSSDIQKLV